MWGTGEVHRAFWWEDLIEGGHSEKPRLKWDDNIKIDLQKVGLEGME